MTDDTDNTKPTSKTERANQIDREQGGRYSLRLKIDQLLKDIQLQRQLQDGWDDDD